MTRSNRAYWRIVIVSTLLLIVINQRSASAQCQCSQLIIKCPGGGNAFTISPNRLEFFAVRGKASAPQTFAITLNVNGDPNLEGKMFMIRVMGFPSNISVTEGGALKPFTN